MIFPGSTIIDQSSHQKQISMPGVRLYLIKERHRLLLLTVACQWDTVEVKDCGKLDILRVLDA